MPRALEIKLFRNRRGTEVPNPRDGDYPVSGGVRLALQNSDFITGLPMAAATTNATPARAAVPISVDADTPDVLALENDTVYAVEATVVGRKANGDAVVVYLRGAAKRGANAAATALVGTQTVEALRTGLATATAAIVADTTDGGVGVLVTGEAASNIAWSARVRILSVG